MIDRCPNSAFVTFFFDNMLKYSKTRKEVYHNHSLLMADSRQPIAIMNRSNILPVGILLLILICSEFSLIKAADPPSTDIRSHITPGEAANPFDTRSDIGR